MVVQRVSNFQSTTLLKILKGEKVACSEEKRVVRKMIILYSRVEYSGTGLPAPQLQFYSKIEIQEVRIMINNAACPGPGMQTSLRTPNLVDLKISGEAAISAAD